MDFIIKKTCCDKTQTVNHEKIMKDNLGLYCYCEECNSSCDIEIVNNEYTIDKPILFEELTKRQQTIVLTNIESINNNESLVFLDFDDEEKTLREFEIYKLSKSDQLNGENYYMITKHF
jgi:hypothetical protein